MRAKDFEDAMRIANNIPFGLVGVYSDDERAPRIRYVYRMEAGLLTINLPERGRGVPAAVRRHEGIELRAEGTGSRGARIYSDYKTVYLKY